MRTIAIVNQKGGCGKTTSAINLAASFARLGRRTLLVDMDPQSHCAVGLGVPEDGVDLHIGDAMLLPDRKPLDESRLLWRISKNLELAPSSVRLAGLEAAAGGLAGREDRDQRLAAVLGRLAKRFDVCLVDCPPTIGLLTFNALRAADEAIIPVETGFFAMRGAERQVRTIRSLARRLGGQTPHRLLATMHKPGESLAEELLTQLRSAFGDHVIPLHIRYDGKLREAASLGRPLLEYAATAIGAQDYADLAAWLLTNPAPATARAGSDFGASDWAASLWSSPPPVRTRVEPTPAAPHLSAPDAGQRADPSLVDPRDLAAARRAALAARRAAQNLPDSPAPRAETLDSDVPQRSVSRAEDLAIRARMLLARSAQLQARLQGDANVAKALSSRGLPAVASVDLGATAACDASTPNEISPSVKRLCGVRETSEGVLFVHAAAPDAKVFVAGAFNAWSPDATPLRFNPNMGVHEACVPLPAGTTEYRLVVDGRWIADPANPADNGQRNSVVVVMRAPNTPCLEGAD